MGALVVPAVAALLLPTAAPTPGTGPADVTALALTAQTTLLEHAGRYRTLEQEVVRRRAELQQAQAAEQAARAQAAADQQVVGAAAAALYRMAPAGRFPVLGLTVADPAATADVLYRQALSDRADQALQGAVVRAERTEVSVDDAARQVAAAQDAVDTATGEAEAVLAATRAQAGALRTEVTGRLAALGTLAAPAGQQDRNQQALLRWQGYLAGLAGAGIEPPRAADLADPARLPAGMGPALDGSGRPVPGVAWAVVGNSPVTVLPAETVAAVSAALSQLGKPYVPGTAGPDTYDCGGFTSAAWLLGGYAVPATPGQQWATGAPVDPATLQVGDLVFSDGGADVGIYLGEGAVLGASAGTYQVGVRAMVPGSSAVRVTLPAPAQPNAPLLVSGAHGACGAPLPVAGPVSAAWGGWSNGRIPSSALCALGSGRHALRCDAAAGYLAMGRAYAAAFGTPLCITDSYRSMAAQQSAFERKPALAAVPGTSNHGWALAVDLCGGINVAGTPQWTWMTANAGAFGFVQPDWARPGGEKPEPWHWEFGNLA